MRGRFRSSACASVPGFARRPHLHFGWTLRPRLYILPAGQRLFSLKFVACQSVTRIAARFVNAAMQHAAVCGLDCDLADPSDRICQVDFEIQNHFDLFAKCRDSRVLEMLRELGETGAMEIRNET